MPEKINKKKRNDSIDKINQQINRIEEIVNSLLEDIDLSEITAVDKLNIAVKFMSQQSRLIALKNSIEIDEPEAREFTLLAAFQRQLRGESVEE